MKIAVMTMQKNEDALLPSWVAYHGAIFGYENVFVFDNGSTSPENVKFLAEIEQRGINVYRQFNRPYDFELKGRIISEFINDNMHLYDFFVPSDADEFLTLRSAMPLSSTPEDIEMEFERFRHAGEQFIRIEQCYYNLSHSSRVRAGSTQKLIVRPGNPVAIDEGFHLYDWSKQKDLTPTGKTESSNFAHVHFHRKDYLSIVSSAREKLKLRVPSYRASVLEEYRGNGTHLREVFNIPSHQYDDGKWIDHTIDIARPWQAWQIGPVPFSMPKEALMSSAIDDVLDPVNLHYVAGKGDLSVEDLTVLNGIFRDSRSACFYGVSSALYLACERGLRDIALVEPDIAQVQMLTKDSDYLAYIALSRLKIINPFRNDLRMNKAPKQVASADELQEAFSLLEKDYEVAVLSGRLRIEAALKGISESTKYPNRQIYFTSKDLESDLDLIGDLLSFERIGICIARINAKFDKLPEATTRYQKAFDALLTRSSPR